MPPRIGDLGVGGGSISSDSARRSFPAETGACCVGASEALTVGPAWCTPRAFSFAH